jgi:hypothetical protein
MSSAAPLAAAMPFETEATAIGNQTLVPGVAPITPRDRLAIAENPAYILARAGVIEFLYARHKALREAA